MLHRLMLSLSKSDFYICNILILDLHCIYRNPLTDSRHIELDVVVNHYEQHLIKAKTVTIEYLWPH